MDWIQLCVFMATMGGFFLWSRSESRSDNRRLEDMMREFHGRLCTLEERYLQILTKK